MSLDIREWLTPKDGRTPAIIVSVAHLDDDERTLVLGVLLVEILAYTRSLPGTRRLRTLDYRTLSNAGFWAVGRLQTDADRERVVDSLCNANEPGSTAADLSALIRRLTPCPRRSGARRAGTSIRRRAVPR